MKIIGWFTASVWLFYSKWKKMKYCSHSSIRHLPWGKLIWSVLVAFLLPFANDCFFISMSTPPSLRASVSSIFNIRTKQVTQVSRSLHSWSLQVHLASAHGYVRLVFSLCQLLPSDIRHVQTRHVSLQETISVPTYMFVLQHRHILLSLNHP